MLSLAERKMDHKAAVEILLSIATQMNTDLVEASWFRGCCSECAKRRGRWFSISGKDKNYPKLETDYECTCEGLLFFAVFPFSNPLHFPIGSDMSKISLSDPIDDRSDAEKELYEVSRLRDKNEEFWREYEDRWKAIREYDHQQYDLLLTAFPDIAPKSYSGYMRMKKGNTRNYQRLVKTAKEYYIFLEYPQEMLEEIEYLKPFREIYVRTLSDINRRREAVSKALNEEIK